ncbi:olfactory receptor 5B12-like [Tachyglossus aculeatus]|uniref:olfactory receptor 5B12-like n=1 Tax=Tachyglossus aculeatus TaxID=9261 RepID=UPI0018F74EBA|nr:olfactory receptor 5B12-like [Tachyglossus aculeatus]
MAEGNGTRVTGFLLKRPSDRPEMRFAAFETDYSATLLANGASSPLLLALCADRRLHTPMYFLLTNLSLPDVSRPTAALYFLVAPAGMDVFLLAVTASDHHWDVLRPLCYAVLMGGRVCVALAAGAWPSRFLKSSLHASFTFTLIICRLNLVDQYYCDVPPVTNLSRSGSSYVLVATAILKSRWAEGNRRAWSTCTSCLLAVGLFYGPAIFTYIRQSSSHSPGSDGLVGMLYSILNTLIDNLRNEEVLRELLRETLGPLGSLRHP